MKKLIIPLLISIPLILLGFKSSTTTTSPQDWSSCVQKAKSEWGGHCQNYGQSEDKYTIFLVNTCTEKVDLMCCVQKSSKTWECFHREAMAPKDTLMGHVCKGTGKYLKWVRAAGDLNTEFPSNKEVNEQYRN